MIILGIDPGGTTGWGVIEDGKVSSFGEVDNEELLDWLSEVIPAVDAVVVENYRVRPPNPKNPYAYSHAWSEARPIRKIGAIEYACHINGVKFLTSEPAMKETGYGWMGLEYKKGRKGTHAQDALAHAFVIGVSMYGWIIKGGKRR